MSSRTLTKSLRIDWDGMRHDTIICPTGYHHSTPLSSVEFSCNRSGASLDTLELCSPLCMRPRQSYGDQRHTHPSNVVVVALYRLRLGAVLYFVVARDARTLVSGRDIQAARNILLRFIE